MSFTFKKHLIVLYICCVIAGGIERILRIGWATESTGCKQYKSTNGLTVSIGKAYATAL